MKTRLDFVSNSSSSSYIIAVEDNPYMMVLNDPILLTFKEFVDKFKRRLFGPSNFYIKTAAAPIIEVSDDEFLQRFMTDTVFVDDSERTIKVHMPHAAIYPYHVNKALQQERDSDNWIKIRKLLNGNNPTSEEYDELNEYYMKLTYSIDDAIAQACYNVLEPSLKDMRFCYQEITDDYRGYCIDDENPFDMSVDPDAPKGPRKIGTTDPEEVMENRKYQTFYEPLDQPHDESLVAARIEFLEKINGPFKFKRIFNNH